MWKMAALALFALQVAGCATVPASATPPPPNTELKLWYRKPAPIDAPNPKSSSGTNGGWLQALPIGNGRLGAMIFGGVEKERIQLNDNTLWDGHAQNTTNPEALKHLPEVRRLLFEGRNREAEELAGKFLMGNPQRVKSYQTLGDLWIESDPGGNVEDYRRELDLSTGVVTITWRIGDARHKRELFASPRKNLLWMRWTCDKPGGINATFRMTRPMDADSKVEDGDLLLSGQIGRDRTNPAEHGMKFEARLHVDWIRRQPRVGNGRMITTTRDSVHVENVDGIEVCFASSTSFDSPDPHQENIKHIALRPIPLNLNAQVEHHRKLFNRVSLNLSGPNDPGFPGPPLVRGSGTTRRPNDLTTQRPNDLPTDERLEAVKKGADDPGLAALYFQYGRYLLLSSSRPGGLPANLQGLWNEHIEAPWNSDYHTNINLQMNYWPAEVTNLPECHLPLVDYMETTLVPSGRKTAKTHYGARGWVVHHLSDVWGFTTPADGIWGIWPMGGAWLAQHPWEHYQFTGDRKFLEKQGYPLMKEAARFVLDFLVMDPKGRLVTNPSHSPENSFFLPDGTKSEFTYGATMDLEIIHDLFTHCIAASRLLKVDADMRTEMEAALKRLAPLQISPKTGRLQEWIEDYGEPEPGHRHISHMFAVYPGDQITPRGTPDMAAAARKSLEYRLSHGGGHTGWSRAWIINLWARFGEGDIAYENLKALLAHSTASNLFDLHPPFQIDGNFGGTSGIVEMLLQSHGGEIAILPALPKAWPDGSYSGLRARGGFEVGVNWQGGKARMATIRAGSSGPCRLRFPKGQKIRAVKDGGRTIRIAAKESAVASWEAGAGHTYTVAFE